MTGGARRRPIGDWLVLAGGVFITLSSAAHAFLGWPGLAAELEPFNPSDSVRQTVAIGWTFGSAAMLAMGLVTLLAFAELPRAGAALASRVALVIGLAYLAFGIGAFAYSSGNPHFFGFMAIGLLLSLGAVLGRRRPRASGE